MTKQLTFWEISGVMDIDNNPDDFVFPYFIEDMIDLGIITPVKNNHTGATRSELKEYLQIYELLNTKQITWLVPDTDRLKKYLSISKLEELDSYIFDEQSKAIIKKLLEYDLKSESGKARSKRYYRRGILTGIGYGVIIGPITFMVLKSFLPLELVYIIFFIILVLLVPVNGNDYPMT